jgi:hypothetical protein
MNLRMNADGRPCCFAIDAYGRKTPPDVDHQCDECKEHFAAENEYAVPDSYARGLTALRAAAATAEEKFEDVWKARLRAALAAEAE